MSYNYSKFVDGVLKEVNIGLYIFVKIILYLSEKLASDL